MSSYRLDQLIPIKQAQQELPKLVERLDKGEGPLVITKRSKPVAIFTTLPEEDRG